MPGLCAVFVQPQLANSNGVALGMLEARVRIELTHKGFADLSLTTWVPRPLRTVASG